MKSNYRILFLVFCFLLLSLSIIKAQVCDSSLIIKPGKIKATGQWAGDGQSPVFGATLDLKSPIGGTFTLVPGHLQEGASDLIVSGAGISTTPAVIVLEPNKNKIVSLTIAGVPGAGKFSGEIQFYREGAGCAAKTTLDVYSTLPNQVVVIDKDQSINLRVVDPGWLTSLLPDKIAQQGINVTLDNKGNYPVTLDNHSLWLKGENTNRELDEVSFTLYLKEGEQPVIPPNSFKTFRFDLDRKGKVSPDKYSGNLRLNFDDNAGSATVLLNMSARGGAFWAIFAMMLGILVGYLTRSIDDPLMKEKIELTGRLTKVNAYAARIQEPYTTGEVQKDISEMEGKIDSINAVEDGDVLASEIDLLGGKVSTLLRLEKVSLQISEDMDDAEWATAEPQVDAVRDNILSGNEEAAKAGFVSLKNLMATKAATRSLDGNTSEVYNSSLAQLESEMSKQAAKQKALQPQSQAATTWGKIKKGFMKAMSVFFGAKINAKVAYWFIRPLAVMVVFIFILWLGFWDLYVEGGETFGADGIYDYMKLFLWGAASNILSRTMMGGGQLAAISQSRLGGATVPPAV